MILSNCKIEYRSLAKQAQLKRKKAKK